MVTLTRRKLVAMIVLFIVVLVLLLWLLVFRGRKPKDTTVHLEGTLTQVFTDCESSLRLGPKGEIINDKAVSCDGGSYIVIDNRV
jgi:hypothetical protein